LFPAFYWIKRLHPADADRVFAELDQRIGKFPCRPLSAERKVSVVLEGHRNQIGDGVLRLLRKVA
jgi:hypothetical protein